MRDDEGVTAPPPLVAAASLAGLEGLLVLVYGVLEAANVHADRAAMGITTAAFFVILGTALATCAWLVVRIRPWARSPIIVVQVIVLGLAWNLRGGATVWLAVGLAAVALLVLAGLLHPASIDALSEGDGTRDHAG